jgi:hypothetical protein
LVYLPSLSVALVGHFKGQEDHTEQNSSQEDGGTP